MPGQLAGLELRHRQHARVEDRIRKAKSPGCATCPAPAPSRKGMGRNRDDRDRTGRMVQTVGFSDHPDLARCEIDTFRYRVLHVAARITRGARRTGLRIDTTWRWAKAIADCLETHPGGIHLNPDTPAQTRRKPHRP